MADRRAAVPSGGSGNLARAGLAGLAAALALAIPAPIAAAPTQPASDMAAQPAGPPPAFAPWSGTLREGTITVIPPNPAAGFEWAYVLAVPNGYRPGSPLFVEPNNDGKVGAPIATHQYWALLIAEQNQIRMSGKLGLATLTPIFPRPAGGTGGNLYIHALSRAALTTPDRRLRRVDLQLLAMIDDARSKLAGFAKPVPDQVLLFGFSASADFATRFAVLHPGRVRALAAGGLGGLPILPLASLEGQRMDYPLGTADLTRIAGSRFDRQAFARIPMLLFQGGDDDNDSVPSRDSYSAAQQRIVAGLFGMNPVQRVARVKAAHAAAGYSRIDYVIVPDAKHSVTREMRTTLLDFFKTAGQAKPTEPK